MAKKREMTETLWLNVVVEKNGRASFGSYKKEPDKTTTEIVTENSTGTKFVKNYELFSEVQGRVVNVMTYDSELSQDVTLEKLSIMVKNSEGKNENIQVNFKTNYADSLIKRLEKIDFTKEVLFRVFRILNEEKTKEKGKNVYNEMLLPYQEKDGKFVAVENPYVKGGKTLPDWIESAKKEKGKIVKEWDNSEYLEALRNLVKEANEDIKRVNVKEVVNTENVQPDNDDLPF